MAKPKYRLIPIVQTRLERVGSIRYSERDISSPEAAVALCRDIIAEQIEDADREHFVAVYLNTKNRPVGYQVASIGTLTAALVHPRELYKTALLLSAHSLIVAHNHPSGNPTPSREDRAVTKRLAEAGKVLGIELLDSLVIGHQSFTSLRSLGALPL